MKKTLIISLLLLNIIGYTQTTIRNNLIIKGVSLNEKNLQPKTKACPTVTFDRYVSGTFQSFTGGSPYKCGNIHVLSADERNLNVNNFEFTFPGWQVRFDLDSKGATDNSVNVRVVGQAPYATNFTQGRNNNTTWIITGYFAVPTLRYEIQLCDASGDGNIPYRVYNIHGTILASGTISFTTPGQCSNWIPINTTDLPGIARFTGPGITDYYDGSADWSPTAAGPGVHNIQYCWNDGNTCSSCTTKTVTVVGPTVNAGIDKSVCSGGSVSIGATPTATGGATPYIYSWSPSTGLSSTTTANPNASPTNSTDYTVTVTDANGNGCSATDVVRIRVNKITITNESSTNVSCNGQNNGTISVTASYSESNQSPLSYSIGTPQNNGNFSGLSAGNYTVTITDAQSCTLTRTYTISDASSITAAINSTYEICGGYCEATATVSASGGTGNLTYSWNDGANAVERTNLCPNTYTVTVTDANNCTQTSSTTIPPSSPDMSLTIEGININATSICNGEAIAKVNGGSMPISYQWSNNATTDTIKNLCGGITYKITVSDANGCTQTSSIFINTTLEIPSAFTPNNDTKNDKWVIKGIENLTNISIKIYNRWGQKVFDFTGDYNNYEKCWDGTYNDKKVATGSYIYIIDFNDVNLKPIEGTVTIVY